MRNKIKEPIALHIIHVEKKQKTKQEIKEKANFYYKKLQ